MSVLHITVKHMIRISLGIQFPIEKSTVTVAVP